MTKPKRRPTILVISWRLPEKMQWSRSPYAFSELFAYPAFVDEDDGRVSSYSEYTSDLTRFYYGLQTTCHIDSDYSTDERPMGSYGISYSEVRTVNLNEAEQMYKTLRSIQSRMEKSAGKFGHTADFCDHLIHFGRAIGAKQAYLTEGKEGIFMPLADLTPLVKAKALELSIQVRILADKHDGTVKVWTTAALDYDGFGTKELQVCDRYRQVEIDGQHYGWQTGRYRSGNHVVLTQAEFDKITSSEETQL